MNDNVQLFAMSNILPQFIKNAVIFASQSHVVFFQRRILFLFSQKFLVAPHPAGGQEGSGDGSGFTPTPGSGGLPWRSTRSARGTHARGRLPSAGLKEPRHSLQSPTQVRSHLARCDGASVVLRRFSILSSGSHAPV